MKKIRRNVFETNSSSTHSIVFAIHENEYNESDYFEKYIDGEIYDSWLILYPGDFGWGIEIFEDPYMKASYIYTYALSQGNKVIEDNLCEAIQEVTGLSVSPTEKKGEFPKGYIDHASFDVAKCVAYDKELLKKFLFDWRYKLIIDHD